MEGLTVKAFEGTFFVGLWGASAKGGQGWGALEDPLLLGGLCGKGRWVLSCDSRSCSHRGLKFAARLPPRSPELRDLCRASEEGRGWPSPTPRPARLAFPGHQVLLVRRRDEGLSRCES